jgi:hypothetical protein
MTQNNKNILDFFHNSYNNPDNGYEISIGHSGPPKANDLSLYFHRCVILSVDIGHLDQYGPMYTVRGIINESDNSSYGYSSLHYDFYLQQSHAIGFYPRNGGESLKGNLGTFDIDVQEEIYDRYSYDGGRHPMRGERVVHFTAKFFMDEEINKKKKVKKIKKKTMWDRLDID